LHPLSPIARIARVIPVLVFGLIIRSTESSSSGTTTAIIYLVIAIVSVVTGIVHWLVTRWRIDGDTLRIETGLLKRDSRRLPLARIQAVDLVRPLAARILGVSELRIRLAGSGSTDGRLAYLSQVDAAALRLWLLGGHRQGTEAPLTEAPDVPMAAVATGRLIVSVLLSLVSILLVGAVVTLLVLAAIAPKAAAAAGGVLAVYLFSFAGVVWRRIVGQFHFSAAEASDGVHIQRGLFSTISETIPYRRIQAVRQVQPLLWRPLGWCRLEVDIAGTDLASRVARARASSARRSSPSARPKRRGISWCA
jgi:putative membrane protein